MATEIVYGVEKVELGTPGVDGALATDFVRFENITDGSVSYTSNADQKTNIIPEDKDVPLIVLYQPGDPDTFNFGLLEISAVNLQKLFNTEVDLTNGTVTVLATRKQTPLQIRLTTRPQLGVKRIFVFRNALATVTWTGNFTKNALVSVSISAALLAFKTASGADGLFTIQTVDGVTGVAEDETPPTVSAGADQTGISATTATLTGTATAVSPKTIVSQLWTKVSGPTGGLITSPSALSTGLTALATGTYVYNLKATDSNGNVSNDQCSVTHT